MGETKLTLELSDRDMDTIEENVSRMLCERADRETETRIKKTVEERVRTLVDQMSGQRIREAVDGVLAEGWHKTDSYGTPKGEKVTLALRISEILTEKTGSYGGDPVRIDKMIQDSVNAAWNGGLNKIIEDAKAKFAKQVDTLMTAKLHEVLKKSLGL